MDDPWANAWGDPPKQVLQPQTSSHPSYTPNDDEETDIALPSWATGAGIQWTDPSDTQSSLWTQPSSAKGWEASPYDSIPIGKVSLPDLQPPRTPSPGPVELTPPSPPLRPTSPPLPVEPAPLSSPTNRLSLPIHQSPSPTLDSPSRSIPGSPDAFGTFESGLDSAEVDPWTPSRSTFAPASADSNTWGAAWGPPGSGQQAQETYEPVDEWEAAKLQKEKQDRQVPPELLASILRQFEELSSDLWPDSNLPDSDKKIPDERDFRSNWRIGMEGVEGLTTVVNRLAPQDLTLLPNVQFTKTFTSKHMSDALRLTRHVPLTRVSPMAQYVASKGSTAWETSVKSRPEVIQDDFSPPGWRVVEKDKNEQSSENDSKKMPSGGLLSFFGRRATTPLIDGKSSRADSPVRAPSKPAVASPTIVSFGSPRSSVDGTGSTPTGLPNPPAAAPSPVTSSSTTTPIPTAPSPTVMLPSTSTTKPAHSPQPGISREPTPPPSAVSRFLNRFSRPKPTAGSSQHNSLTLSSNDLEFLSDVAPSASDDVHSSLQLQALSNMIESSPLPTKLPPPLAPPPRPPAQPTRVSSNGNRGSPSASKTPIDDFTSLFDSPGPIMKHSVPPASPHPSAPAVLPLPLSPTAPSSSDPRTAPFSTQNINPVNATLSLSSYSDTSADKSLSPPFGFPPPPSSRTHTPVPPPPKRTQTAIMSTSSITPPKSMSPFRFPPPPSPRTQTPIISPLPSGSRSPVTTNSIPPPIPPPTQSETTPTRLPASFFGNDDDFSDFHSPPSQSSATHTSPYASGFSSFSASGSSDQGLFSSSSNTSVSNPTNLFDDFDDFVSSTLRTPSPPRPPAKMTPFVPKPLPSSVRTASSQISSSPPQPAPKRRMSRAANHSRTLSLLEVAAAHSGRWPAPPSPLPAALPPPGVNTQDPFELDLFGVDGSGSTMQAQQAKATAELTASASSPAAFAPHHDGKGAPLQFTFPPPTNGISSSSSPPLLASSPSSLLKQPAPPALANLYTSPASGSTKSGGLSAQDLSFFEGL